MFFLVGIIVVEAYSLRLSVMELESITPTRLGPALPTSQSPAVGGAGPGPSQKADRARPETPHSCDGARRNSCTDRPSSARHSRPISRPPWGVPGRVRHKRPTTSRPAPPKAVTEPSVTLVRSATFAPENTH
jgi:hypothetical protein